MSGQGERVQRTLGRGSIVPLFVILQALVVFSIWSLGAINETTDRLYALYLSVDLVSFAAVSYLYRVDYVNRGLLAAAVVMILILILPIMFGIL